MRSRRTDRPESAKIGQYVLGDKRLEKESYEEYRERRKFERKMIDRYLKGERINE